jgi:hypothetical protein
MKHPKLTVQIPEPCHEDWYKMSPTEKGKFCHVCTKEVVDFTAKSDEEIINYFQNHGNICARFHDSQLNRKLIADRKQRNHWLSYAASLLLPLTLFSKETAQSGKKIVPTEQTDTSKFQSLHIGTFHRTAKSKTTAQEKKFTITGIVSDDTGMPLHGVIVSIKATTTGTTTDFDGKYQIEVKAGDTLVISYVGYGYKEIRINKNRRVYNEILEQDDTIIGMVVFAEAMEHEGADQFGYVSNYDLKDYTQPMTEKEIEARDKRIKNYFAFQRKKWLEKRAKRREKRAAKKAKRN